MVTFPNDWRSYEHLFTLSDSQRVPVAENDRPLGSTPYYGANGVQGYIDGSTHQGEYVLIAEDGASNLSDYPVRFVSGNIWVNNHAHVLSGIEAVSDTKYLSYAFKLVDFTSILVGGTRAKLNGRALKGITFPVPRIQEQRAIADVLSGFDEYMANLDELIVKKKAIRDGAVEELVTGKIQLRSHSRTDRGRMVAYPEDWTVEQVENLCDIHTGSGDTQDAVPYGQYPFYVRSQKIEHIDSFEFDGEAVLTAGDGVGTGKVFHYATGKFKAHQRVYVLDKFKHIDGRYFFYYFSSHFLNQVEKYTAKSSVDSIRRPMIAEMTIPVPSLPEQRAITEVLSGMDEEIRLLEEERVKVERLKLGAMDDLLTGRVRLPIEEEAA